MPRRKETDIEPVSERSEKTIGDAAFADAAEKEAFELWTRRVAAEMEFFTHLEEVTHEQALSILIGDEEEPGTLYPDGHGYPEFYGFPLPDEESAEDVVYFLYDRAFEPEEEGQRKLHQDAYLKTYVNVDTTDKGRISAAGVLTSHGDHATSSERLSDSLLFHEKLLYVTNLVCPNETDLLRLYRRIRSSGIQSRQTRA